MQLPYSQDALEEHLTHREVLSFEQLDDDGKNRLLAHLVWCAEKSGAVDCIENFLSTQLGPSNEIYARGAKFGAALQAAVLGNASRASQTKT